MRLLSLVACLLLVSCPEPPCPDLAAPVLAACVAPAGGWDESPSSVELVEVSFAGDVIDTGTGTPPEPHCFQEMHVGDQNPPSTLDVAWLRVQSGGSDWFVGLSLPDIDAARLPQVGDEASFDYRFAFGGFGPDVGHLTVWDDAGGLIGWFGQAGAVDGLIAPTGITVARGSTLCSESDECGAWSKYHLGVAVPGQSEIAVDYGSTVTVDGFEIVHAGYEAQTSSEDNCSDWFVGDVQVAVLHGE